MPETSRAYTPRPTVTSATLEDEVVLLDMQSGIYFGLDSVGAHIWQLVERGTTAEEIARAITARYDVDPAQARSDVEEFLRALQRQRLIDVRDER